MNRTNERIPEHKNNCKFLLQLFIAVFTVITTLTAWKTFAAQEFFFAENTVFAQAKAASAAQIEIGAASGATIPFIEQTRRQADSRPPEKRSIPHLVLFRNGELANPSERTLTISIHDLVVPSAGATASLRLETQSGDPDLGGGVGHRIVVWEKTQRIEYRPQTAQGALLQFTVVFPESITRSGQVIATPTGYYRLELAVSAGNAPGSRALFSASREYAFLLERQIVVPLDDEQGPDEMVVYFCDMFPFQMKRGEPASRLLRTEVPEYVQTELLPQMLAAIRLQNREWGFSWSGWVGYGSGKSGERLEVSLSDGETWYHGPAPERGLSSIAINVNALNNAEYETLTDSLMSTFHHELFHNFQRAMALSDGGSGTLSGKENAWHFFSEGTAALAASVAQQEIQFSQSRQARAYIAKAVKFVGGRGFPGELNTSYTDLDPYQAAIYWRFLYEQCSGLAAGREDPAAGMGLIRRALQVLYSGEVVDMRASTDLVGYLPLIMERVLKSAEASGCPFQSYVESLAHFARAIYGLRLADGRCPGPSAPAGCGFYDPNDLYSQPAVEEIPYQGKEMVFSHEELSQPAGIRSSFGMDFIELELGAEADGQPLKILFRPDSEGAAEFQVQAIRLQTTDGSGFSPQKLIPFAPAETFRLGDSSGSLGLTVPAVELEAYDRIGIIITRVDADEHLDPVGAYTLVVRAGP